MIYDEHICGAPSKNGYCTTKLSKYVVRCEKHAVIVYRKEQRLYIPNHEVKAGDEIVSAANWRGLK